MKNTKLKSIITSFCLIFAIAFSFFAFPVKTLATSKTYAEEATTTKDVVNGDFSSTEPATTVEGFENTKLPYAWEKATGAEYSNDIVCSVENEELKFVATNAKFGLKTTQAVSLLADSYYTLSFKLKTTDTAKATLYISGGFTYDTGSSFTTAGEYQTKTVYIETHSGSSADIFVELWIGSKDSAVSGTLLIDDVKIKKVTPTEYYNAKNAGTNICLSDKTTIAMPNLDFKNDTDLTVNGWTKKETENASDLVASIVKENEEIFSFTNEYTGNQSPETIDETKKLVTKVFENASKYYYDEAFTMEVEATLASLIKTNGEFSYIDATIVYLNTESAKVFHSYDNQLFDKLLPFETTIRHFEENQSTQIYKHADGKWYETTEESGNKLPAGGYSGTVYNKYYVSINGTEFELKYVAGAKYYLDDNNALTTSDSIAVYENKAQKLFFTKTPSKITFPVYGSDIDRILKLTNNNESKALTYVSPKFMIEQWGYYKVSVFMKTNCEFGDETSSLNLNLVGNQKTGSKPNGDEKTATQSATPYTITNETTNNWTQYVFFVKGSPISTTETTLEFQLTSKSTIYVDHIEITRIEQATYTSATQTLDLSTNNASTPASTLVADTVPNGHFNISKEVKFEDGTGKTTFPITPASWTTTGNLMGLTSKSGIVPTSALYTSDLQTLLDSPVPTGSNNLNALAIYSAESSTYGYKSDKFTAKASKFYELKFDVYTSANFTGKAYSKVYSSTSLISDITEITTTSGNWATYTYYIKGGIADQTLYIEQGINSSIGTVFFKDIELNEIEEDAYIEKSTEVSGTETKIVTLEKQKANKYLILDLSTDNFTSHTYAYDDATNHLFGSYTISKTTSSTGLFGVLNTEDTLTGTAFSALTKLNLPHSGSNTVLAMHNADNTKHIAFEQTFGNALSANTYYKLSVWVKTVDIDESQGLKLTFKQTETDKDPLTITFDKVNTAGYTNADNNDYKEYSAHIKVGADAITSMLLSAEFGTSENGLSGFAFIGEIKFSASSKQEFNNARKICNLTDTAETKFVDLTQETKVNKSKHTEADALTIFFVVFSSLALVGSLVLVIIVVYARKLPKRKHPKANKKVTGKDGESRNKGGYV